MRGAPTAADELAVLQRALERARQWINDATGINDAMLERKRPRQAGESDGADTRGPEVGGADPESATGT